MNTSPLGLGEDPEKETSGKKNEKRENAGRTISRRLKKTRIKAQQGNDGVKDS